MKTKTLTEWLEEQRKLTYVEVADHHTALKIIRAMIDDASHWDEIGEESGRQLTWIAGRIINDREDSHA